MNETTRNWKWYCGGGVVGIAVVLGCATAVDFKTSGREAGSLPAAASEGVAPGAKFKRGVATEPGHEHEHNGGKIRLPVSVSFDGDSTVTLSRDRDVAISILAGSDIQEVQGLIQGIDGLDGVKVPLDFTSIAAGETKVVTMFVPAKTGSLVLHISGTVGTGASASPMSASLSLRVVNPRDVKASSLKSKSADMLPVTQDATGLIVQPMRAGE